MHARVSAASEWATDERLFSLILGYLLPVQGGVAATWKTCLLKDASGISVSGVT